MEGQGVMREVRYPGESSGHSGGSQPGEDNHRALMTNAEAKAARELRFTFKMTVSELRCMYSVSHGAMSLLLRGKTYKEAGGPLDPGRRPPGSGRANPRHRRPVKSS
jgi:hypothetical protein